MIRQSHVGWRPRTGRRPKLHLAMLGILGLLIGVPPAVSQSLDYLVPFKGAFSVDGAETSYGNLVVVAFSEEAEWGQRPFVDYSSFDSFAPGKKFAFATDLDGVVAQSRIDDISFSFDDRMFDPDALNIIVPPGQPRIIEIPFWPVPGFGKVWVSADNGGRGFVVPSAGAVLAINLNYEVARTAIRHVAERLQTAGSRHSAAVLAPYASRLSQAETKLATAGALENELQRAQASDGALRDALILAEDLELDLARREIPMVRRGRTVIRVVDDAGRPVPGAAVQYQQVDHSFLFGVAEAFGFLKGNLSDQKLAQIFRMLGDAGFNHFSVLLNWYEIEQSRGRYRLDEWDRLFGLRHAVANGMSLKMHPLMQGYPPDYAKNGSFTEIRNAVTAFSDALITFFQTRYPDAVNIIEVVNEAAVNDYEGLSQSEKVELTRYMSQFARSRWPGVPIMINDVYDDYGQRYQDDDDHKHIISPYEWFRLLNQSGVDYDQMGLQWWPGLQANFYGILSMEGPLMDFARTAREFDRYASLGKPLHITEIAVPSSSKDSWDSGRWRQNWSTRVQSDYLERFYTLAFSKPYIKEVTYWGISDNEPWIVTGGILDKSYRPKPAFETLSRLIRSWTSSGSVTTDAQGQAAIDGFGGTYEVTVTSATGQTVAQVPVIERENQGPLSIELR